jgi:hypothetical protein
MFLSLVLGLLFLALVSSVVGIEIVSLVVRVWAAVPVSATSAVFPRFPGGLFSFLRRAWWRANSSRATAERSRMSECFSSRYKGLEVVNVSVLEHSPAQSTVNAFLLLNASS